MRKILAVMLLLAVLLLTVVACDSKGGKNKNSGSSTNTGNNPNDATNKIATPGFVFELNEDENGYIITDYMGGEVDICIPATYNNLPVTEIDSNTFNDVRDTLISVCFADNMQLDEIVCWCFDNCVNLKSVIIPNGVTNISYNSFLNCTSLESITIPDSVQRIDEWAFSGCVNLKNVYIGENSSLQEIDFTAFYECDNLKFNEYSNALYLGNESNPYTILYKAKSTAISSCSINEKTRAILDGAFSGCSGISQITIPNSVKFIGLNVFSGCEGLNYNTYDNAYYIGSESNPYFMLIKAKDKTISLCSIHNDTEYICSYAFSGCENLTGITIPKNIKGIGSKAFYQCTAMTRINYNAKKTEIFASNVFSSAGINGSGITATIGADVQEIPPYFSGWDGAIGEKSKLVKVVFEQGSSCKKIGHNAFYCSPTLQSIELPNSIVTIDKSAFINCTALQSIVIPNSVKEIGEYAFQECSALANLTLGNGIETIGTSAFIRCTELSSLTIPSNVRNVGNSVFFGCTSLRNVTIMQGVTRIGTNMFSGCSSLENVEIPKSVIDVGSQAFYGCTSLVCSEYDNAYYIGTDNNPYLILIKAKGQEISSCIVHQDTKFIDAYAFQNCKALTTVKLGNNITNIGFKAFDGCTRLEGVYINSLDNWCGVVFESQTSNPVAIGENLYINDQLVVDLVIPAGIEEIGDYAFFGCLSIKSVKIPDSVKSIGINAFYNCSNITSVYIDDIAKWCSVSFGSGSSNPLNYGDLYINEQKTENLVIPNGVTEITKAAFAGCKTLQTVTVPSTVVCIGEGAFVQCINLHEIDLPDSIVSMDAGVFAICENLSSITIPKNITYIPKYTFAGCGSLSQVILDKDSKLLLIGEESFLECKSLENLIVPDGVAVRIGKSAFSDCTNLLKVELGDDVTSIDSSAFKNCTNLKDLTIGDHVTNIGSSAFIGCINLSAVTIPDSITSIGSSAFSGCDSLTSVTIGNGVESIGSYAFSGCDSLTSIAIPDSVTSIEYGAFSGCPSLASIIIPDSVTIIDSDLFADCISLTSVVIPDSVTSIEYGAFSGCSSLANIIIPDSVTIIGSDAFSDCISFTSITIPDSVTSIGVDAFSGCYKLVEVINKSSLNIALGSPTYGYVAYYAKEVHSGNSKIVNKDGYLFYTYGGTNYLLGYVGIDTVLILPENYNGESYEIYKYALYGQVDITSVTIPSNVTGIGEYAFASCDSSVVVNISDLSAWCQISFEGYNSNPLRYTNNLYLNGELIVDLVIPSGVTSIGSYAFSGCESLASVTIPDSIETIGDLAFEGCISLTNIKFENSGKLTSIGNYAFYGCTSLKSITIPASVTSIGYSAFRDCASLTSISFEDTLTWYIGNQSDWYNKTGTEIDVSVPTKNDDYFKSTYYICYWYKK